MQIFQSSNLILYQESDETFWRIEVYHILQFFILCVCSSLNQGPAKSFIKTFLVPILLQKLQLLHLKRLFRFGVLYVLNNITSVKTSKTHMGAWSIIVTFMLPSVHDMIGKYNCTKYVLGGIMYLLMMCTLYLLQVWKHFATKTG